MTDRSNPNQVINDCVPLGEVLINNISVVILTDGYVCTNYVTLLDANHQIQWDTTSHESPTIKVMTPPNETHKSKQLKQRKQNDYKLYFAYCNITVLAKLLGGNPCSPQYYTHMWLGRLLTKALPQFMAKSLVYMTP